jgi:hypothetical protein
MLRTLGPDRAGFRTPDPSRSWLLSAGHLRDAVRGRTELVEEGRPIVARRGFGHIERHEDPAIRVRVEHVLNDGIPRL